MDYTGEQFLDKLYKDLYKSDFVMHRIDEKYIGNKKENIRKYIERLEHLHNRVSETNRENDLNILKSFYYDKYVIKESDIPESYYKHQQEILLERGYGHITLSNDQKHEMAAALINDQKKSLDVWIEYFVSKDSSMYPMWTKYWAFMGMLNLGGYNKATMEFTKRSKNTVSVFTDLNREALSLSIDNMIKYLNGNIPTEDEELEKLLSGGSFGKLYAYSLTKLLRNKKDKINTNEGIWKKYDQGSDHMPLVKSLEGHGTGWCTAGESTAKTQLQNGDFYVYYSLDEKGNPTIPRIAIRMENGKIAEIRGVAESQNIEAELEEIVDKKLEEFPDREKYKKKVSDMGKLTGIYKNKENLSKEDLRFLYEVDSRIQGFGYVKDPRITEILSTRNIKQDLAQVFDCNEKEIGTKKEDLQKRNIICYYGDLSYTSSEKLKKIKLPLKMLMGNLRFDDLTSAKGLKFPEQVHGDLYLDSLRSAEGLILPQGVKGCVYLDGITSAEGLVLPLYIEGGGGLGLRSLTSAKGLILPQHIDGHVSLISLTSAEGLVLPQDIGGGIDLRSLTSVKGLILPQYIGGFLDLRSLTSAEGLVLPQYVGYHIDLRSLTSIDGITLPQNFKEIYLPGNVIITPENINEFKNESSHKI